MTIVFLFYGFYWPALCIYRKREKEENRRTSLSEMTRVCANDSYFFFFFFFPFFAFVCGGWVNFRNNSNERNKPENEQCTWNPLVTHHCNRRDPGRLWWDFLGRCSLPARLISHLQWPDSWGSRPLPEGHVFRYRILERQVWYLYRSLTWAHWARRRRNPETSVDPSLNQISIRARLHRVLQWFTLRIHLFYHSLNITFQWIETDRSKNISQKTRFDHSLVLRIVRIENILHA